MFEAPPGTMLEAERPKVSAGRQTIAWVSIGLSALIRVLADSSTSRTPVLGLLAFVVLWVGVGLAKPGGLASGNKALFPDPPIKAPPAARGEPRESDSGDWHR